MWGAIRSCGDRERGVPRAFSRREPETTFRRLGRNGVLQGSAAGRFAGASAASRLALRRTMPGPPPRSCLVPGATPRPRCTRRHTDRGAHRARGRARHCVAETRGHPPLLSSDALSSSGNGPSRVSTARAKRRAGRSGVRRPIEAARCARACAAAYGQPVARRMLSALGFPDSLTPTLRPATSERPW